MTDIKQLAQQIIKDRVVVKCESPEHTIEVFKAFEERGVLTKYEDGDERDPYDYFEYAGFFGNIKTFDRYSTFDGKYLTLPDFIARYPLETREIVGWKFKEDKYKRAGMSVLGLSESDIEQHEKLTNAHILEYSNEAKKLSELQVLELWFDPVYKEVEIPPKGIPVLDNNKKILISTGRGNFNEGLRVVDSFNYLDNEEAGQFISTWTVYKGGKQ